MFDSPPSNLPIEPPMQPNPPTPPPIVSPSPPPPPRPQAPPPPAPPLTPPSQGGGSAGKREPEDIFADLDHDVETMPMATEAPGSPPRKSPLKMIVAIFVLLLVIGGGGYAAWAFFLQTEPAPQPLAPADSTSPAVVPSESEPVVEIPPPFAVQEPVTTPPPGANVPPPDLNNEPEPPAPTPVAAADTDGDGLTDPEEPLFGSDAATVDSDGDTFPDGSETQNGYDPAAGNATLSVSPRFRTIDIGNGWSVHVPSSWVLGSDTVVPGDYAVRTGTLTTFSLHFDQKASDATFQEWLALREPTVDATSLRTFTNASGLTVWQTQDRLTSYVVSGANVSVVRYMANGSATYEYPGLYAYVVLTMRMP